MGMDDQDKILVIKLLLGQLTDNEKDLLKRRINNEPELNDLFKSYSDVVSKIDVFYASRSIKLKIDSMGSLSNSKKIRSKSNQNKSNTENMGSNARMGLLVSLMLIIAVAVTLGFNYFINWKNDNANKMLIEEQSQAQILKQDSIKSALQKEEFRLKKKGIDITGIAITRSGLYLTPYEWVQDATILATSDNNTNKIPATILWDDESAGLAVLKIAVGDQKKLKTFPYIFSSRKFFLGEEIIVISSNGDDIIYNFGRVIDDNKESNILYIKVELDNLILGAPVIDNYGQIIGLIKSIDPNGMGTVQKSISIFTMIAEMNLDKGVERIIMPKKNSLSKLPNPDRLIALQPYLAHFNVRKTK